MSIASSMPPPTWFLRQMVTVNTFTSTVESGTNSPEKTAGTTHTVLGNLQPNTTTEGQIYQAETGNQLFTLFLAVQTSAGDDVSKLVAKTNTYTVDGVVHRAAGAGMNLVSNTVVIQIPVYIES